MKNEEYRIFIRKENGDFTFIKCYSLKGAQMLLKDLSSLGIECVIIPTLETFISNLKNSAD